MRGELATIVAHEYPSYKEQEDERIPWPTLYCHPQARGPFIRFDERERRRWERLLQAEQKENEEKKTRKESFVQKQLMEQPFQTRLVMKKTGDLRRSVSMNNMQRNAKLQTLDHDVEADGVDSVNASGYLASGIGGYVAASGNSVGITSTTGTTSAVGYTSRNLQIPSAINLQLRREVIMRKQPSLQAEKLKRANTMGPPAGVPQRSTVLRKSKSTNTLKLPKREEGSKPGYCESCRQKFTSFKEVS
jgi:regulatory subunit for Cdc7p protein kinase